MKILTVLGARPQFIKAAAVSREFRRYPFIKESIVHTGQHYDTNMSDIFFQQMEIPYPDHRLETGGLSQGAMTGRMLENIEKIINSENPDKVMVYGDTNSTLAGALAAVKLHIPVVHVEAGLRSFNMEMPEEVNRILTDQVSSLLCCPTETAIKNLKNEGFFTKDVKIVNTGDVMQDVAYYFADKSVKPEGLLANASQKIILCTLHRAENTNDEKRLKNICNAISQLSERYHVVLPLHPRTQKAIEKAKIKLNANIIKPVGYFEMLYLLKSASLVLTDSGGLQKEAYFFSKPCVTMRDQTEWTELIDQQANVLVGAGVDPIITEVNNMLAKDIAFNKDIYGGGSAARRVVESMVE